MAKKEGSVAFTIFGLFLAIVVLAVGAWGLGALAILVGMVLNNILIPLGMPDFNLGMVDEVYTPVFVGIPLVLGFLALVIWLNLPSPEEEAKKKAVEDAVREAARNRVQEQVASVDAFRERQREAALIREVVDLAWEPSGAQRDLSEEDEIQARIRRDFADENWAKLWAKFKDKPFTFDDVINLGNTVTDANMVLSDLKDRGIRQNVGFETFVLVQGPPED